MRKRRTRTSIAGTTATSPSQRTRLSARTRASTSPAASGNSNTDEQREKTSPAPSPRKDTIAASTTSSDGDGDSNLIVELRKTVVEYKKGILRCLMNYQEASNHQKREPTTPRAEAEASEEHLTKATTARDRTQVPISEPPSQSKVTICTTPKKKISRVRRTSTPPQQYSKYRTFEKKTATPKAEAHGGSPEKKKTIAVSKTDVGADTVKKSPVMNKPTSFSSTLARKAKLTQDLDRLICQKLKQRLIHCAEPARTKSHWDFLLDEMKWMANDFYQERRWKIIAAARLSREAADQRNIEAIQEESNKRKIAQALSLKVSTYWRSIELAAARNRLRCLTEGNSAATSSDNSQKPASLAAGAAGISISTASKDLKTENEAKKPSAVSDTAKIMRSKVDRIIEKTIAVKNKSANGEYDDLIRNLPHRLTEFQTQAVSWMLSMNEETMSMFVNDQIGLASATSVGAFLRCLHIRGTLSFPLLVVTPDNALHKWVYSVHQWLPEFKMQVYGGSTTERRTQQRLWVDDDVTIHIVMCKHAELLTDEVFFKEQEWSILVAEAMSDKEFTENDMQDNDADSSDISNRTTLIEQRSNAIWSILCALKVRAPRVLMGYEVPSAPSTRAACIQFLLGLKSQQDARLWESTILENGMSASLKVLHGLSIRRLRNEVDSQFCKIEEESVACTLSSSQAVHYRDCVLSPLLLSTLETGGLNAWLALLLRLRSICNGVELLGKTEKMCHADLRSMESCSGKLAMLGSLLFKLQEEKKRIIIYAQHGQVLELVEFYVGLLGITCVRITGSPECQQRALVHFALRDQVQVAIVSTRCAASGSIKALDANSYHAVTIYGAQAVVVFDSDWDPIVDAKLRASWQLNAIQQDLNVYRLHCEGTVEASLLRSGSCLTEKLFNEVVPRNLIRGSGGNQSSSPNLGISVENIPAERPQWWSSISPEELALKSAESVREYNDGGELGGALRGGAYEELDDAEHLLLSNTDELLPIEWYGVHVVSSFAEQEAKCNQSINEDEFEAEHERELIDNSYDEAILIDIGKCGQKAAATARKEQTSLDDLFYDVPELDSEDTVPPAPYSELLQVLSTEMNHQRFGGFEPDYSLYAPPDPTADLTNQYVDPLVDHNPMLGLSLIYRKKIEPPKKDTNVIKPIKIKKKMLKNATDKKRKLTAEEKAAIKRQRLAQASAADAFSTGDSLLPYGDDELILDENYGALDVQGIHGRKGNDKTGPSSSKKSKDKQGSGSGNKSRKQSGSTDLFVRDDWSTLEDQKLLRLRELYPMNWNVICHILNHSITSPFSGRERSARQCNERYMRLTAPSYPTPTTKSSKKSSADDTPKTKKKKSVPQVPVLPPPLPKHVSLEKHKSGWLLSYEKERGLNALPPPGNRHLRPLYAQLHSSKLDLPLPPANPDTDVSEIDSTFGHIFLAMQKKPPPPSIPGTEKTNRSNSVSRAHTSHFLPTKLLTPQEIVEVSRKKAQAAKEAKEAQEARRRSGVQSSSKASESAVSSKEVASSATGSDRDSSKYKSSASARSTLAAISARVGGMKAPDASKTVTTPELAEDSAVTTSTLLYVIDRMPGVKSQIQQILQRSDSTESQKVEMIARLLKAAPTNSGASKAPASSSK